MDFIPKYKDRFKGINCFETPIDVMSGYESPINVIMGEMKIEQENEIFRAIQNYGVFVDREELIKALKYDREQYGKGYIDGIKKFTEMLKGYGQPVCTGPATYDVMVSGAIITALAKELTEGS